MLTLCPLRHYLKSRELYTCIIFKLSFISFYGEGCLQLFLKRVYRIGGKLLNHSKVQKQLLQTLHHHSPFSLVLGTVSKELSEDLGTRLECVV